MVVRNIFSKRRKAARGEISDVYEYDTIPDQLKIQVWLLIEEIASILDITESQYFGQVVRECAREGVHMKASHTPSDDIRKFLNTVTEVSHFLDFIEIAIAYAIEVIQTFENRNRYERFGHQNVQRSLISVRNKVNEMNVRMKENAFGYEMVSGEFIQMDNQLLHDKVIKPTLSLTNDPTFATVQDEILEAFSKHRHGDHAGCLSDCNKAIESTLDIIITKMGWTRPQKHNMGALLKEVFDKGLVPHDLQNHYSNLASMLTTAVSTPRNQPGRSHGKGTSDIETPDYMAELVLHQTAADILFLIKAYQAQR